METRLLIQRQPAHRQHQLWGDGLRQVTNHTRRTRLTANCEKVSQAGLKCDWNSSLFQTWFAFYSLFRALNFSVTCAPDNGWQPRFLLCEREWVNLWEEDKNSPLSLVSYMPLKLNICTMGLTLNGHQGHQDRWFIFIWSYDFWRIM